jgi:hypothetical protein
MATYARTGYGDPSVRVYAALVRLYPRAYRRAYGPLMVQLFRDQVRDARGRGDTHRIVLLYLRTLADLLGSAFREYGYALGVGEPIGGWSYPRATWWQALLAGVPGLLLIATDSRLFRLVLPWAPYPHPTAMALLSASGCLAIVIFALLRERRLPDWAFPSVGALVVHGPYAVSLIWREGSGPMWSALGLPSLALVIGSAAGLATVLRRRLWSAELPKWAWIVAALSVVAIGSAAANEAAAGAPWDWGRMLMALWRWAFSTAMLVAPLLCAATAAPTRGARSVLLVLPVVLWWSVGMVLEPDYGVTMWTSDRAVLLVIDLLPTAALLVLMPVALLRVRSAFSQAATLLLTTMGMLLVLEVLRAGVLPAYDEGALFAYRSGLSLQLAVSLAFVVALYDRLARSAQMDWLV